MKIYCVHTVHTYTEFLHFLISVLHSKHSLWIDIYIYRHIDQEIVSQTVKLGQNHVANSNSQVKLRIRSLGRSCDILTVSRRRFLLGGAMGCFTNEVFSPKNGHFNRKSSITGEWAGKPCLILGSSWCLYLPILGVEPFTLLGHVEQKFAAISNIKQQVPRPFKYPQNMVKVCQSMV